MSDDREAETASASANFPLGHRKQSYHRVFGGTPIINASESNTGESSIFSPAAHTSKVWSEYNSHPFNQRH